MNEKFAQDVLAGLKAFPKRLSSKYFYDAKGDKLFQKIMALPEYYLTRSEYSIFKRHKNELLKKISTDGRDSFDLIELGSGDGTKTKILLEHFLREEASFNYYPIDISENVLDELVTSLNQNYPALNVKGIPKEYFEAIKFINRGNGVSKKVVLFLGSNIGNFDEVTVKSFTQNLSNALNQGDMVLIGFDLKKNPEVIKKAYDDDAGITKEFNLNLLERINRELEGDFDLNNFMHYSLYDPEYGKASSYLISKKEQEVNVLDEKIFFDAWESIHTEISQKFDPRMIKNLADDAGFEIVENFFDQDKYYVDALWRKK